MSARPSTVSSGPNGTIRLGAACLLAACSLPGCLPAAPNPSQLAGDWQGRIVVKTSRPTLAETQRLEAIRLTILPDGRFAARGLTPTDQVRRSGQVIRPASAPGLTIRVIEARYTPTESGITLEYAGRLADDATPMRGGQVRTAKLLDDGQLEYRFFGYGVAVGDASRSEGISHYGRLRRVAPAPNEEP